MKRKALTWFETNTGKKYEKRQLYAAVSVSECDFEKSLEWNYACSIYLTWIHFYLSVKIDDFLRVKGKLKDKNELTTGHFLTICISVFLITLFAITVQI